jgi:hypothetical protein
LDIPKKPEKMTSKSKSKKNPPQQKQEKEKQQEELPILIQYSLEIVQNLLEIGEKLCIKLLDSIDKYPFGNMFLSILGGIFAGTIWLIFRSVWIQVIQAQLLEFVRVLLRAWEIIVEYLIFSLIRVVLKIVWIVFGIAVWCCVLAIENYGFMIVFIALILEGLILLDIPLRLLYFASSICFWGVFFVLVLAFTLDINHERPEIFNNFWRLFINSVNFFNNILDWAITKSC